jgi:hypothetical protein
MCYPVDKIGLRSESSGVRDERTVLGASCVHTPATRGQHLGDYLLNIKTAPKPSGDETTPPPRVVRIKGGPTRKKKGWLRKIH